MKIGHSAQSFLALVACWIPEEDVLAIIERSKKLAKERRVRQVRLEDASDAMGELTREKKSESV